MPNCASVSTSLALKHLWIVLVLACLSLLAASWGRLPLQYFSAGLAQGEAPRCPTSLHFRNNDSTHPESGARYPRVLLYSYEGSGNTWTRSLLEDTTGKLTTVRVVYVCACVCMCVHVCACVCVSTCMSCILSRRRLVLCTNPDSVCRAARFVHRLDVYRPCIAASRLQR